MTRKIKNVSYDTEFNITKTQFSALQILFNYYNDALFTGSLPECILNFSRKSKAHGFFAPDRWQEAHAPFRNNVAQAKKVHEISINPEGLRRDPKEVLSTLVHEMCHLWQYTFGKPKPGYHNKEWAAKMKEVGLQPTHNGEPGGKETGRNMTHLIVEGGAFDDAFKNMDPGYLLPFVCDPEPAEKKKEKKKKNKVKYSCPGCASNVWGKPEMLIVCGSCSLDEPGEAEEGDEPEPPGITGVPVLFIAQEAEEEDEG